MEREHNSFSKTSNVFGRADSGLGLEPGGATNSDLDNPALPTICGMIISLKTMVCSICNVLEIPCVSFV